MFFEYWPTELLAQVYLSCDSIQDVTSLSTTCKRLRGIYTSPGRRLRILEHVVETQYGPLEDAIQLVTHNSSQPAHILRKTQLSLALLRQIVDIGHVARKWEEIYPSKHWHDNYEDRRLLTSHERYVLRRALYRLWLYSRAFHTPKYTRYTRMHQIQVFERAQLLHNWSDTELAEMVDVHAVIRETVRRNICPSNGTIQQKFRKRFPDSNYQLLFNMHLNYPLPSMMSQQQQQKYKYYAKYRPTPFHEPGCEGWGDDTSHYYIVEDMMKLDPGQIVWLKENAPSKVQVETFLHQEVGSGWFENNGETFGQTLEFVLNQRGDDVQAFLEAVADGEIGVAL